MLNRTSNSDEQLVSTVSAMKAGGAFKNYIDFIQFPYFRNLAKDTRINFDFPLTVFVGQNGSGKSSTLHALYGAPKKYTPYDFWFSTEVDPIEETSTTGDRHCFYYSFKKENVDLEVIKTRIFKKDNPDYWETSRPIVKYGMKKMDKGRNKPIEKDVTYIDFRAELSAFDKYFYFRQPRKNSKSKNKQEYLRKKSVQLKKIIDQTRKYIKAGSAIQNEALHPLSNDELKWVSKILGRQYIEGSYIKHKLFEEWGVSIYLKTNHFKYSEAFAGSGELAVVRLVHEVLTAPDESLILLDEPEVSLHPGAQERLRSFLLEFVKLKRLQIVISSHSPNFIDGLPPNAIKVFSQLPDGRFSVQNEITPEEAFYYLEQTHAKKKNIITEDVLSKRILEEVLKEAGDATASLFDVSYYPGGASVLLNNHIPIYSQVLKSKDYIIFDGDQRKRATAFDPDSIPAREQTTARFAAEIKAQTGVDVKFYPDGNKGGGDKDQILKLQSQYLKYFLSNVYYLPKRIPEEIIWDEEAAEKLLEVVGQQSKLSELKSLSDVKKRFVMLSELTAIAVDSIHNTFITKWIKIKNQDYQAIAEILKKLKTF